MIFLKVNAQVVANFAANTTSGCPNPLLVIISDLSTNSGGGALTYSWTVTNPNGVTLPPSFTNQFSANLSIPGFYSVTLTVCNSAGICDTKTVANYIEIFEKPTYNVSFTPSFGCAPQEICFNGTIDPGCGTVSNIIFDSNDGVVYNTEDFCHTYIAAGNYHNFTVSVENSCGCVITKTITDTVKIVNTPVASFTTNQNFSCTSPLNVAFTNTSTASSNATYIWNIPGVVSGVTTPNFNQSFNVGNYDVELIVTEPEGCTDTIRHTNYISVGNPIADFSASVTSICVGESIQFSDSSNGTPLSYEWEVIGGATATGQNPSIPFNTAGVFSVKLTTNYAGGCQDVEIKNAYITVHPKPTSSFTVSESASCIAPFTTTFTSTSTNSVGTGWSFPGGTPSSFSGTGPVNVTYNTFDSYNITMFDTSSYGCIDQTTFNNVINLGQLTATIAVDTVSGCSPVVSKLTYFTNGIDSIVSINWTLPGSDILNSQLEEPVATYTTLGCNDVSLTLTTADGCTTNIVETELICVGTPPIANFDFTPISTCFEVDDICFTFTGSGADSIRWNFDDGPIVWANPGVVPCHMYNSDIGDYSPSIIAYNNGCPSDTLTFIDSIEILGPVAVFTSDIKSCVEWNTINFTNTSVMADSSYWVFGDPSAPSGTDTSTQENPSWTYPAIDAIKTYSATLVVYNLSTGCDHTVTNIIKVYPPNASFTQNKITGCAPLSVLFTNTSYSVLPDFWNTRWNWDSTYVLGPPAPMTTWNHAPARYHVYTNPGIYDVIMRNEDARGCLDTILKDNLIVIHGVNAGFTSDMKSGCVPLSVNFTDTSVAPLSYVTSWHWNFGTGNPADTSSLPNPTFIYNSKGKYNVTLTVVDSAGCAKTITYNNYIDARKPQANISVSDTFICSSQNINITNLSSGDSLNYNWQLPNATILSTDANGNPTVLNYAIEGVQDLYLEITDNLNCTSDTSIQISVFDLIVAGTASNNFSVCPNPPLFVNFTNNSMNNIDSSSVVWNFGNGNSSTDYSPSTLYSTPGEFVVTLTVNSKSGCTNTVIIDTIVIEGPWGELELITDPHLCYCDSATFAITTINATTPIFLTGDGQAKPFFPIGAIGEIVRDTLTIQYCGLGEFIPSISFSEGACTYNVSGATSDTVRVDSLIANFNFSNNIFCDTGTVCFTDSSFSRVVGMSSVNSWYWDFGTGNPADTSTLQNPCHFYDAPGSYYVCLDVTNINGCSKTYCDTVLIRVLPNTYFAANDSSVCINNIISFSDSSSAANDAVISNWNWNFGTGILSDISTIQNPSFNFIISGVLDVTLEVEDNFGCKSSDTLQIEIFDNPIIQAITDTFICLYDSVQVFATGGLSYAWSPNQFISDTSIADPFVMPIADAAYYVVGTDTNGCSSSDMLQISVSSIVADFVNNTACLGDTVFFTDISNTSLGTINDWAWNFDDVISGSDSTSTLKNPYHIFEDAGSYNVVLSIQNDLGCITDTTILVEISVSPTAIIDFDSVCVNIPLNFSSLNSLGGSGNIVNTDWNFGTGNTNDISSLASPTFTYTTPGLYTVCLTVTSDLTCAGNTHDTCVTVMVYEAPIANQMVDSVCLGNSISFSDLSTAGDGNVISNFWSFGQNIGDTALIFSNIGDTSFNYNAFGTYNVTHIVTDDLGCRDTSNVQTYVFDNPNSSYTYTSICLSTNNPFVSTSIPGADGANAITKYFWNFDEGAGLGIGSTPQSFNFANIGNHNISLVVEDAFGCTDTSTQTINILVSPKAVLDLSEDQVCEGFPVTLDASNSTYATPSIQYAWDQNYNTGIDNTTVGYTYTPTSNATIMLVITDNNYCTDTAFTNLKVHPNPVPSFTAADGCVDFPLNLASTTTIGDTAISVYGWIINGIYSSGSAQHSFTPNSTTNVTVQLAVEDLFGCVGTSNVKNLLVDTTVYTTIGENDTIICAPSELSFSVSGTANKYTWKPANIIDNANLDFVSASIKQNQIIIVTGTSLNDLCPRVSDSVTVILVREPEISYTVSSNPVFVDLATEIELNIVPFNEFKDSILWDYNSELTETYGLYNTATPSQATDYPFTVLYYYDSVSCQIDSFVNIQIIDECSDDLIHAPNVFTPNNDMQNDLFKISGQSIDYFTFLRIFDRWGKLIFEKSNVEFKNGRMKDADSWDGRNKNGKFCNNGVYVFMYEGVCLNGKSIISSGNITLIR